MSRTASRTAVVVVAAIAIVLLIVILVGSSKTAAPTPTPQSAATSAGAGTPSGGGAAAPIGERTKTEGCAVSGPLQDRACTPGAIFPSATKEQICVPGYSKNVRNVPEAEKNQVYAEYGIRSHKAGAYEVDHLISLELGGSNEIANLWPEAADPRPGFHEKDKYENYAHDQVCRGEITLQEAQRRIATDWLMYWQAAGQP